MSLFKNKKVNENGWNVGKGFGYNYEAKVYDEGSKYGINGGKVSKLAVKKSDGKYIAQYDREWVQKPKSRKDKKTVKSIIDFFD